MCIRDRGILPNKSSRGFVGVVVKEEDRVLLFGIVPARFGLFEGGITEVGDDRPSNKLFRLVAAVETFEFIDVGTPPPPPPISSVPKRSKIFDDSFVVFAVLAGCDGELNRSRGLSPFDAILVSGAIKSKPSKSELDVGCSPLTCVKGLFGNAKNIIDISLTLNND